MSARAVQPATVPGALGRPRPGQRFQVEVGTDGDYSGFVRGAYGKCAPDYWPGRTDGPVRPWGVNRPVVAIVARKTSPEVMFRMNDFWPIQDSLNLSITIAGAPGEIGRLVWTPSPTGSYQALGGNAEAWADYLAARVGQWINVWVTPMGPGGAEATQP